VTGFPADNLWFLSRGVSVAHLLRSVLAEKTPQRMRVLDIGAGYGHVLYALRALLEVRSKPRLLNRIRDASRR